MKNFNSIFNQLTAMPKRLAMVLTMLLTVGIGSAWGAEYTITFKSASSDSSSDLGASPNVSNVVYSGTSYVASFSGCSKMYVGKSGIKLGSSSAGGTMNFTLATNYQSNIKSIKVVSAKYGSDTGTLTLYSGGSTSLKSGISPGTDYTHTFSSPTKVTSLKLTSSKRAYITKIVITTEEAATCTQPPTISAATSSDITQTTAMLFCSGISSLGSAGCSITSYGFVYGTTANPTITSNTKVQVGTTYTTTGDDFSKELTGLTANTTYYVRPYATNGNGTAYGAQTSFTTLELSKYTITWNVLGAETGTTTIVEGQEWTLPEVDASCNGKQFVGWTTTNILEEQDEAPAPLYTETNQFPLETNTYYAVFANVEVTGSGEYVKLTEALTDYSGEYLIVYEAGSRAFNGGLEESSLLNGNENYIPIAISDNVVQATDEVENARFIVAKVDGGYSIQSASGLYIGRSENSNGMDIAQTYNENLVNTFPNCSTIRGTGGADLQYNNNTQPSQQNRFRYYSSAQQPIALYKKTGTNMTNYTTSCVPTYTITWQNDDGTVLETDKVAENTMPEYNGSTPIKAADAQYTYTFEGWTPAIAPATTDATYTATYTKTVNTYTITWKNEDGTPLETDENVPYGETPTYNGAPPAKTATAQYTYTFNAWTPAISTVTGNATYTATFTETVNKYQVTFNMNGHGDEITAQTVDYGSTAAEPSPAPTADGYVFAGWYKDGQCTIPWNFDTDEVTGITTIYAKWLQIFTITWKANGLEYATTKVTEGEQITPPSSPNLGDFCGQVFVGWTTAEMVETMNVAPTLYPNPTSFPTASEEAPKTFYAVFADYEN